MRTVRRTGVVLAFVIGFLGALGQAAVGQPPANITPPLTPVPGTAGSSVSITAVSVGGRVVSATGIGDVWDSGAAARQLTVTVYLQTRANGSDLRSAVEAADRKAAGVRASVQALGISPLHIRTMAMSVSPEYGPTPSPGDEPVIRGYIVNRTLQVDTSGPPLGDAVMRAALTGGATSVSAFPSVQRMAVPGEAALAPAVGQATRQAEAAVRAAAAQLGVSLGPLQRLTVGPPHPVFVRPGEGLWRVEVTVIYALAPSH